MRIQKKLGLIVLSVLVFMTLSMPIYAESIDDFSIKWEEKGGALQGNAIYHKGDIAYEMIINGTRNELDNAAIQNIAEHLSDGKAMSIINPGIIDAEKFSNICPLDYMTPRDIFVDMSGIRSEQYWGDSLQCWGSSVATMLTTTGWAKKAVNPDSGSFFESEDEVFSFFTKYCYNKGCYAANSINFFFNGVKAEDIKTFDIIRHPFPALLPNKNLSKYLQNAAICDEDETDNYLEYQKGLQLISQIKAGGSIGLSVNIYGCTYNLKDNPRIYIEKDGERYRSNNYINVNKDKSNLPIGCALEEHFYAINENDEVVLLRATECGYEEISGRQVDIAFVKKDVLLKKADGTYLYPNSISEDEYTFIDHTYYSEDQIEITKNPVEFDIFGGHAITANGYIKNLNTGNIEGLFITNSDDDSWMMPYEEENLSKENRPNKMVVYPTREIKGEHNITLALEDWAGNDATIARVTLLMPEEEHRIDPDPPQKPVPNDINNKNSQKPLVKKFIPKTGNDEIRRILIVFFFSETILIVGMIFGKKERK